MALWSLNASLVTIAVDHFMALYTLRQNNANGYDGMMA
jgi:hypothetical protein